MGIEPTRSAWKAGALPLSYTREIMVEREGFEPSYALHGQIYSLLPLTTRPPLHASLDF